MRIINYFFILICLSLATTTTAHINPKMDDGRKTTTASYRMDCAQATSQVDQAINNVRARLLTGGDVWWDGDDGRYIVPNVAAGADPVSSIYAGAVWLGGTDPADNLKVAAQSYGTANGTTDFWPGPLVPSGTNQGTVSDTTCLNWDKHFRVLGSDIDEHIAAFEKILEETGDTLNAELELSSIKLDIRGWPAKGNNSFFEINNFELPNTEQGLAPFFDRNSNGIYDPERGDYPIIEIRGCNDPQYPDEMWFWIYNDNGGVHTQTNADPIQMEVQVQAFAYATNDELNDMTFQRYKLINRAKESIDSTFFAMWVDPDLGCAEDDYIGCDVDRSLMFIYNEDSTDGEPGVTCGGVPTYGTEVPILGVDYFRGPLGPFVYGIDGQLQPQSIESALEEPDTIIELGMSSFMYYNNGGIGNPDPVTTDPGNATEFYNYLTGSWLDGTPLTEGGNGLGGTVTTSFAFPGDPDDTDTWTMCSENIGNGDRRTIQASGPFLLKPGAVNELIIGVPWVPDISTYPCPSLKEIRAADDIAQSLFDNCFDITDGPDAPDVCFIELNRELVLVLSNENRSNNIGEQYQEIDLLAPGTVDNFYRFEGYKVYQLVDPNVSVSELADPTKAALVGQFDLENNIDDLYNWTGSPNPDPLAGQGDRPTTIFGPDLKVEGRDRGIRHTFNITEDFFASDDTRLINHKKYYYMALAYAHNNYEQFNPSTGLGQARPYLEGRKNVQIYTAIPRPITDRALNADYGEGTQITRLDGEGAGGNFLDITDETRLSILDGSFDGEVTYKPGRGPIMVQVYDPLRVQDGEYILRFVDSNMADDELDVLAGWSLYRLDGGSEDLVANSDVSIDQLNEQLIANAGFSVTIDQTPDSGDITQPSNGALDQTIEYADPTGSSWLTWIQDGVAPEGFPPFIGTFYDFLPTGTDELFNTDDPNQTISHVGNQAFAPFKLTEYRDNVNPLVSPAWVGGTRFPYERNDLATLNNVDIVLTPNKDLWSRCIIVETASPFYYDPPFEVGTDGENFNLRSAESVGKNDNNGDGLPDRDDSGTTGLGWFPGYAIDVETGKRLNIFFGENSYYSEQYSDFPINLYDNEMATGNDMLWNPTSQILLDGGQGSAGNILSYVTGGQHFVYVTEEEYDECETIRAVLAQNNDITIVNQLIKVKWASVPLLAPGADLLPLGGTGEPGLIPNEATIKIRVDNPFQVEEGADINDFHPAYRFILDGKAAADNSTQEEYDSQLDMINIVPNPYYGFSSYEISQFSNIVKITNLPAKSTVTIYSLDGKFIRQYKRNEREMEKEITNPGVPSTQINPDIEWDLKNNKGIPVSSGVYLIHVDAEGLGERVIKWFGVSRQFDPSGL